MLSLHSAVTLILVLLIMALTAVFMVRAEPVRENPGTQAPTPESRKTLTIAAVSSRSRFGDIEGNLAHFEKIIQEAASQGARLICFPELALAGYSLNGKILAAAESIPGPSSEKLEKIARSLNVYISMGMAEKDGERYYITQCLVGPEGYIGKYRKSNPTPGEKACGITPGQSYHAWDIDGFKVGFLICYDGRYDSTIEAMKQQQVDVIHHPHGNYVGDLGSDAEEWTRSKMVYFVSRAVRARAYIVVNNSAEDIEEPGGQVLQFSSGALVLDPLGQVVQRTTQPDRMEKMILVTVVKPLSELIPAGELKRLELQAH